jgi:hypothetical protein
MHFLLGMKAKPGTHNSGDSFCTEKEPAFFDEQKIDSKKIEHLFIS